jgi:hypothetical protein
MLTGVEGLTIFARLCRFVRAFVLAFFWFLAKVGGVGGNSCIIGKAASYHGLRSVYFLWFFWSDLPCQVMWPVNRVRHNRSSPAFVQASTVTAHLLPHNTFPKIVGPIVVCR